MSDNNVIILLILAAAAIFLLLRLRSLLGTRTGFEDPEKYVNRRSSEPAQGGEGDNVVALPQARDAQNDEDIFAVTEPDSDMGKTLKAMKNAESGFDVRDFVDGSKSAYEMLLTAFEMGDKQTLKPFLSDDVYAAFEGAIDARQERNLAVDMRFIGFRTAEPISATFDVETRQAEITMRFVSEVVTATRNERGDIVEGDPQAVQKVNDVWTFSRSMGSDDPNWILVATGG